MKKILVILALAILVLSSSCTKKPAPTPTPTAPAKPITPTVKYNLKVEDLVMAAQRGDNITIKEILYYNPQLVNVAAKKDPNQGYTALHLGAADNKVGTVKVLLKKGAKVNVTDRAKRTPLHYATDRDHLETVEVLLKHKAKINAKDVIGLTPLHLAAFRGNLRVQKKLLDKGANPNAKDKNGQTPLHWAALYGKRKAAFLLLKYKADINAATNSGMTVLDLANSRKEKKFASFIKSRGGLSQKELNKSTFTKQTIEMKKAREKRIKELAEKDGKGTITEQEREELKKLMSGKPVGNQQPKDKQDTKKSRNSR